MVSVTYTFDVSEMMEHVNQTLSAELGTAWGYVTETVAGLMLDSQLIMHPMEAERKIEEVLLRQQFRHYDAIITARQLVAYAKQLFNGQQFKSIGAYHFNKQNGTLFLTAFI